WVPGTPGLTAAWSHLPSIASYDAGRWLFSFFIVCTLVALLWFLVRYLYWTSTVYAVTNSRVIIQRGIWGRNFDEIPVQQVRGVDVHQSFGMRLLGYGTVKVSSEGGTKLGNEDWRGIPRPFEFQRLIENATQALGRSANSR
ncbi:MAG: PH domain-containing protein, partial [Thermoplasmata archaeon]|nr:PH domain-containing protein [Thermoplasmata archaeon]